MKSIWSSVQEAFQAIGPHYQPVSGPFVQEAGYEDCDWFISFIAYGLDPEPLTAVTLQKKLFVYSHPDRVQQLLTGATTRGFLAENQTGQYTITAKGRDGMDRFFEIAWDAIAELLPIPEPEMNLLARLLYRSTRVGREIPEALYEAVAEVLAYVYRLDRSRAASWGVAS